MYIAFYRQMMCITREPLAKHVLLVTEVEVLGAFLPILALPKELQVLLLVCARICFLKFF